MVENNKIESYYISNTKFSRTALAQVYEILIRYEDEIENVPEKVIRFLDDNRDKEYVFDYGEDLENFKLEKDAENLVISMALEAGIKKIYKSIINAQNKLDAILVNITQ